MGFSIKLTDSVGVVETRIKKAIAQKFNAELKKKAKSIEKLIKGYITTWILEQPEVADLSRTGAQGSLHAQFGLLPGQEVAAINAIINSLVDATSVVFTPFDQNLKGGLEIRFQPSSLQNIIDLPEGQVITEDTILYWLEWLLVRGSTTIIVGYFYKPSNKGRSGGGTMNLGGVWRVDPRFAGTLENNFITRAFSGRDKELTKILKDVFNGL